MLDHPFLAKHLWSLLTTHWIIDFCSSSTSSTGNGVNIAFNHYALGLNYGRSMDSSLASLADLLKMRGGSPVSPSKLPGYVDTHSLGVPSTSSSASTRYPECFLADSFSWEGFPLPSGKPTRNFTRSSTYVICLLEDMAAHSKRNAVYLRDAHSQCYSLPSCSGH